MSSDTFIDVEQLLSPISDDAPSGTALSLEDWDGPLAKLENAFSDARKLVLEEQKKILSGGIDEIGQPWRNIPAPDWGQIIDLSVELLRDKSKDFRAAAWLTEALLRKHQIAGLRDGLELCVRLCETYWETIHPAPDEDGHLTTVRPFKDLMSSMCFGAILDTKVVIGKRASDRDETEYTAQDFINARELETLTNSDERERRIESGQREMPEFKAIAELTSGEVHTANLETLAACIDQLDQLGSFLNEHCQDDSEEESTAPSVTPFREKLEELRRIVLELRGEEPESEEDDEQPGTATSGGESGGGRQAMTRQSAFQTIESIAAFFEKTEPHSPVQFALRQAVRWGRMPLPELLAELVEDSSVMDSLRKQIGLPQPPPEEY